MEHYELMSELEPQCFVHNAMINGPHNEKCNERHLSKIVCVREQACILYLVSSYLFVALYLYISAAADIKNEYYVCYVCVRVFDNFLL